MKTGKLLLLLAISIICLACNHTNDYIFKYINSNNLSPDKDTIDLQDVLGLKYDSMYLFCEYTNYMIPMFIRDYSNGEELIEDSYHRILLFKDNKIVYEDDYYADKIQFEWITEKLDTIYDGYLVHYGSQYKFYKYFDSSGHPFYHLTKCYYNHDQYDTHSESGKIFYYKIK